MIEGQSRVTDAAMQRLDFASLNRGTKHSFALDVVRLGTGVMLSVPLNIVVGTAVGPNLVLIAGVHGDESEGVLALMELWRELEPSQVSGTVVMVPVANPPAFAAHRRTSPLDELDLNRVFPGRPDGKPSERIAFCLVENVVKQANFVFSMHSWYATGTVLPYVEVPPDGPTAESSLRAAHAAGFSFIRASQWPNGLLPKIANNLGIPAIEAEIGGSGISTPANRELYKDHALALMAHLGMGVLGPRNHFEREPRIVTHRDIPAPAGGILAVEVSLGAPVHAGQCLARIADFSGTPHCEIIAEGAATVAAVRMAASVAPGDVVFRLFSDPHHTA